MRLTPQRLAIFREIAGREDHPDAEAIHRAVVRRMPGVSLDTVYRTLQALLDLGLVTTLGLRRGCARFDPNTGSHHHFVCERCGMARDFASDELDAIPIPAAARAHGRPVIARVEVRGVCSACDRSIGGNSKQTARHRIAAPARPVVSAAEPARRRRRP